VIDWPHSSDPLLAPAPASNGDASPSVHRHNPGVPLQRAWFADARVNRSAVERRAESLTGRRSVKKAYQAAWLVKALTCIDLTTLAGDDTPGRVQRLAAKARRPLRADIVEALGLAAVPPVVGAVCVYPTMVATAEIDIVITRAHALLGDWDALFAEVRAMREACGPAHLKVILGTGELGTLRTVYAASMVAMMAGADFIKTSTGKEDVNATLPVSLTMLRAIRDYGERTGVRIGFKPAGGLRTAKDALAWLTLMNEELGRPWLEPNLFRIGASSLLGDIERQLEHYVTGRYAAASHHALA
jgi:deoxyribose-phosphate aldolase